MGFGKKQDSALQAVVNLDEIYHNLIQPSLNSFDNIESIRGDEISNTEIIDAGMFELLLSADIVIADITTLNPNAIYELGIRHALKPYSTIILGLDVDEIPFDFSHNRILQYSILDFESEKKLNQKIQQLENLIDKTSHNIERDQLPDSPFYNFIKDVKAPNLSSQKLNQIKSRYFCEHNGETISSLLSQAKKLIEIGNYSEASQKFGVLAELNKNNPYYQQQQALFLSKEKKEDYAKNLKQAEKIIWNQNPLNSFDTETMGIYGGIEKRLFQETGNEMYLENALRSYNRGFVLCDDYYNGENVVNCLLHKLRLTDKYEDLVYLKRSIEIQNTKVIKSAEHVIECQKANGVVPDYWVYATAALSYLLAGNKVKYGQYKDLFLSNKNNEWEERSFNDSNQLRLTLLQKMNRIEYLK
jgi:hypothetical protein